MLCRTLSYSSSWMMKRSSCRVLMMQRQVIRHRNTVMHFFYVLVQVPILMLILVPGLNVNLVPDSVLLL